MRTLIVVAALLLCAGLLPAHAAGDVPPALSARLKALAPDMEPDHVIETPLAGMYEVRFSSTIVYLSADGRYMLRGDLMDLEAQRNFTEEARRVARADAIGALGEASMIVFAPDTVKHTVTVFTDVDCPYCARMHQQMADYNGLGIEVRYAAFPRAGVSSPTYDKMVSVWCAADQRTAMTDAKMGTSIEILSPPTATWNEISTTYSTFPPFSGPKGRPPDSPAAPWRPPRSKSALNMSPNPPKSRSSSNEKPPP